MIRQAEKERYWVGVERALETLHIQVDLEKALHKLQSAVEKLPISQQELFYHTEPLDVARDLTGRRPVSGEQVREYLEKVRGGSPHR